MSNVSLEVWLKENALVNAEKNNIEKEKIVLTVLKIVKLALIEIIVKFAIKNLINF